MSTEQEILKISKKLDKIINGQTGDALALLKALKALPMDLDVLQKTRIGMTVNALRKSNSCDEDTANLAKQLIKTWKKLLDNTSPANSQAISGSASSPSDKERKEVVETDELDSDSTKFPLSQESGISDSRNFVERSVDNGSTADQFKPTKKVISFPSVPKTTDEVRLKCCEMIANSLKLEEMPDGTQDPDDLSRRIENAIFELHKGSTGDKYKACVRSRVFNLRDKKNTDLRINVLVGAIAPKRLATMTSEEMASPDMKKLRDKFTKEAISEHQMAEATGTPTDMFKCGKCKGQKCTYTQLQTRSADEPMTTFVFCTECGNRWKFC